MTQARVIGKFIRDSSYMDDRWKEDRSGRCIEEERIWNDLYKIYLVDDTYTSVVSVIMKKSRRLREETHVRTS